MIHRRRFLQGLGAYGASLGAADFLTRSMLARAQDAQAPKRLLLIGHCHGWPYDAWKMRLGSAGETQPWAADLSTVSQEEWSQPLAPLYAHRNRLLALDGLSLATAELDVDGNRHDTGWVQAWTGNWADFTHTDTRSTSASLDQIVAAAIARGDRLPSLELSVDADAEGGRPIGYGLTGARLPVANTPAMAWQRLFGLSSNSDPLILRQQDILDYAYGEYQALLPKLGATQRNRLDSHYGLLNSLGDRIQGLAGLTCPSMPDALGETLGFGARFDAFADLIGAAFACDITRVISLSLGEIPTADFGWDHLTDDVHKGLAHEIYNDPEKHQAMTDYLTMHAEQVAQLVSLLESIPDTDGNSVMDNTLIVWGSELANGWHGYQHYCPVIIGGSWYFSTGRYLYWPHETPIQVLTPSGYSDFSGKPHQHLLVSVGQAMGLDVTKVGIDHVQSQTGVRIDCTGPLPDLT